MIIDFRLLISKVFIGEAFWVLLNKFTSLSDQQKLPINTNNYR